MNRCWAWGLILLPFAGLAVGADNDPGKTAFQRFNGGPPVNPLASAPAERPKAKPPVEEKKPTDTTAALRAQEEANLLRRMAVCDRVQEIALANGDSKLEADAIRLSERAAEVYKQRTANLPSRKPAEKLAGGAKP